MKLTSDQRRVLSAYWNEICNEIGSGPAEIKAIRPRVEWAHLRPQGLFSGKFIGDICEDAFLEIPVKCKKRPEAGTPAWWHMVATIPVRPHVGLNNLHMLVTLTQTACYGVIEAVAGTTVPLSGVIPMYKSYIRAGEAVTVDGLNGLIYYVGPIDDHDQPDWIGISLDRTPPASMFRFDEYPEVLPGSGGRFTARNAICARPHRCALVKGLHYDRSDKIALNLFGYGMRGNCGLVCGREGVQAVHLSIMTANTILILFDHPYSCYKNHSITSQDKAACVAIHLLGMSFMKYGPGTAVAHAKDRAIILAYPKSDDIYPYEYEHIMLILRAEAKRKPVMKLHVASGERNCRVFVRTIITRLVEPDDVADGTNTWPAE